MAYLGNDLQVAFPTYRNIDDISGSFNGVTTSFPLTVAGVAPIPAPINSQQCLISVNGVVQRPDDSGTEGFRLSGGNIIFASAPAGGVDFFGVILAGADYVNIGANFPSGTAVAPSITFDSDLDTGIYNPAGNQIGFTTSGVQRLVINSSGQISGGLGTAAAPVISFISDPNTGIYSPGADQVAISTGGSGRLFVDASGNTLLGSYDNSGGLGERLSINGAGLVTQSAAATNRGLFGTFGGSTQIIGAFDNIPLEFRTNNTERLRITSAGLVGIGTSSPSSTLDVRTAIGGANINIQGGSSYAQLTLTHPTSGINYFNSNTNLSIQADGSNWLRLQTNGSTAVFVDSSQRVGIGTTSPSTNLHVLGGGPGVDAEARISSNQNGAFLSFAPAGTNTIRQYAIGSAVGGSLIFFDNTASSQRAAIDSSGRLLVGTSSTSAAARVLVSGGDGARGVLNIASTSATPADGDDLGFISFNDSSHIYNNALIRAQRDGGTWTATTSKPTRLTFSTTADGASSPTERMRIAANGQITHSLNGTTNAASLVLNVGGAGDPGNSGWITPRIDFTGSSVASLGTTFIGATGSLGGRSLVFATGADGAGSERARLTASGQLLVGTSSASGANTLFESSSTTANAANVALVKRNSGTADQAGQQLHFYNFGPASTARAAGTEVGSMRFYGSQPTSGAAQEMASITCAADLLQTGLNTSGRLVFSTTADGASSPTERLRISQNGVVEAATQINVKAFGTGVASVGITTGVQVDATADATDCFRVFRVGVGETFKVTGAGAVSKASGSFKISHPLPEKTETHYLVHSFIEGPQADLIYRGHTSLINGTAQINIDEAARMTEGTFEALCTNVCCFTSNETDWTPVRGHVDGNVLTIEAQDPASTAEICWMVVGERKDPHMLETDWTDTNGRVITEPLKQETANQTK